MDDLPNINPKDSDPSLDRAASETSSPELPRRVFQSDNSLPSQTVKDALSAPISIPSITAHDDAKSLSSKTVVGSAPDVNPLAKPSMPSDIQVADLLASTQPASSTTPYLRLLPLVIVLIVLAIGTSIVIDKEIKNIHPAAKAPQAKQSATPVTTPAASQAPELTYTDPKGYFTLKYPADWVTQTSTLTLDSVGGDTWLERFNLVPANQARTVGSPNYNSFVESDVVQGAGGSHIVSMEQAAGAHFTTKTNLTINHYPAVYTQQKIADSTVDTYIISNQDIAVIMALTEKQGPGVEKAYPKGYDRSAYTSNLSAIAHSITFLNSTSSNGLLPGAN